MHGKPAGGPTYADLPIRDNGVSKPERTNAERTRNPSAVNPCRSTYGGTCGYDPARDVCTCGGWPVKLAGAGRGDGPGPVATAGAGADAGGADGSTGGGGGAPSGGGAGAGGGAAAPGGGAVHLESRAGDSRAGRGGGGARKVGGVVARPAVRAPARTSAAGSARYTVGRLVASLREMEASDAARWEARDYPADLRERWGSDRTRGWAASWLTLADNVDRDGGGWRDTRADSRALAAELRHAAAVLAVHGSDRCAELWPATGGR